MQRNFDVLVEKDEAGYYIASVPAKRRLTAGVYSLRSFS